MKVLAWPAFNKSAANPHAALLSSALRDLGVDVRDWTVARALLRGDVDLWHIHHPDTVVYPRSRIASLLGTLLFAGLLSMARRRGTRILWTVHDLGSNDGLHPRLEAWFWRFFLPRVDAYVCLTEGSRQRVRERLPELGNAPGFVTAHGHYRDAYPGRLSRERAREALGLAPDATVILHFGLLRPYKNVPHLIDVFRQLPDAAGSVLVVAGRPFDGHVEREVRRRAEGCPRVQLHLRWIPPDEVQPLFAASDLLVLPYRRVLNSGAALLALSCGRPVLLPDLGVMREHQQAFGADWIRLYTGELTAQELLDACQWARLPRREAPDLSGLDWVDLARQTCSIYERVVG